MKRTRCTYFPKMNFRVPSIPSTRFFLVLLGSILAIGLAASVAISATAQSGSPDWGEPVNLSRSGGSSNPTIIANNRSILLVVWDADIPGSTVRQSGFSVPKGESWSETVWLELPFSGRPVQFLGTDNNRVHAFWIDEDGDLRFKVNSADDFGALGAWNGSVMLASSVLAFNTTIDSTGVTHIVFLTTQATALGPAGVYYLRSIPNGTAWRAPVSIYQSDYYLQFDGLLERGIDPSIEFQALPEVDNEVVETEDGSAVLLSWSNPALKRVFMVRSLDGGFSWESIEQVDGPDEDNPYRSPSSLIVTDTAENLIRLWNSVQRGGSCELSYQVSGNAGESWGEPANLLGELNQCPDDIQPFRMTDGNELFVLSISEQTYFAIWDGTRWSDAQLQQGLGFFTNPATYGFVQLGCKDAALIGEQVFVAGCDLSEGGDIWLLSAPLENTDDWFQNQFRWQETAILEIDSADVISMGSVYDAEDNLHVLWSVKDQDASELASSSIYYGGWHSERLIGPFKIIQNLPGRVSNLSVSTGPENQISMIWNGGQFGEIFFSSTSRQEAPSARGWLDPEMIVPPGITARASNLIVDADGSFMLAYAIPANEEKGIYILKSPTDGSSWEELSSLPLSLNTACPLVQDPKILDAASGKLHVVWTCATLPGGVGPLSLNHAVLDTTALSWTDPGVVVEASVRWSQLARDGDGLTHLVWEEVQSDRTRTRHSIYQPGTGLWSDPRVVFSQPGEQVHTSLSVDQSGRLHIVQVSTPESQPRLEHRTWNGLAWVSEDSFPPRLNGPATALATNITSEGDLIALFMGTGITEAIDGPHDRLVIARTRLRQEQSPAGQASLDEELETPAQEQVVEEPDDQQIESEVGTESPVELTDPGRIVSDASTNSFTGLILGGIAALAVVLVIFIQRIRTD